MSREFWDELADTVNSIHALLQKKPREYRKGYYLSPGSILNAYREGDLTFDEAVKALDSLGRYSAGAPELTERYQK